MTFWVVVSILALMLSPMVWLLPSRRTSGRMALRLEARRMGLAMQLTRKPGRTGCPKSRRTPARSIIVRAVAGMPTAGATGR